MGTRHLVAVKLDGEYRIAQYGQWDGYPSGQGATVLEFLSKWDRPLFEKKLRASGFYTPDELKALWHGDWLDRNPHISRDTGADILQIVQDAPDGIKLKNAIDFAGDSLFCEYGYVIDLDGNVLEVFKGFNKEPLADNERFAKAPRDNEEYYPIRRIAQYPLYSLPSAEAFLKQLEPEDEEEAA